MALFEYKGINKLGKTVRGSVTADNQRAARVKLKKDGIFIQNLKDKQKAAKKSRKSNSRPKGSVSVEDMAMMTRQLATLIKANIPLVECLGAVTEQVENPVLKEALSEIKDMVNEGLAFNKALAKYPNIFNNIYIFMSEAGEASGTLDIILLRLAEFTEAQNALNKKVKSALTYPVIMVIFSTVIILFLFIYLIPKITKIFDQVDGLTLPWYSKMVIDLSDFLIQYWMVLGVGTLSAYFLFQRWKSTPNGSAQWDRISLKLPIAGHMVRLVAVSRFTKTLSTLLAGGVPMLQSLDIVKRVVNNAVLTDALQAARDNISEGESVAGPLKKSGEFPPLVIHMISVGEKTGDLENMLTQVSEAYDFQVKNSIDGLTSLLEPIMIVVMGAIILVIVLAVLVPILQMQNAGF